MKAQKSFPLSVGFFGLIVTLVCIAGNVYEFIKMLQSTESVKTSFAVSSVLIIIALLSALVYFIAGYRKNAAGFFKGFIYLYALQLFQTVLFMSNLPVFCRASLVIQLILLCIMATGLNLGETKSHIICALNFVLNALNIIYNSIITSFSARSFGILLLAVLLWIMTGAKYSDKAYRGTN